MTQTVQHDDRNQVKADSKTAEAQTMSIAGVDPELGFGGGETQVLGLTLALAAGGHRAELICDPAGRLWEQATAAGLQMPSDPHPQRDRPGGRRQAARYSETRALRRCSFSYFARAFDGAAGARIRQHAGRYAADGLSAQSCVRAVPFQSRGRWRGRDLGRRRRLAGGRGRRSCSGHCRAQRRRLRALPSANFG